jgi:hypothetical protein
VEELVMKDLRNFAPWIAFAVVSMVADWRAAATIALATATVAALDRRHHHEARDDLAAAGLVYFTGLTVVAAVAPASPVHAYIAALSPAALAVGAALSIIRGRPFTIPFAKRSTPPELWDQPRFYDANVTISLIWTLSFAAAAVAIASVVIMSANPAPLVVAIQALGFIIPMRCTAWYRRQLQARYTTLSPAN